LANIVQRYSLLTKRNVFIEKSEDYFKVKLPMLVDKPNIVSEKQDDDLKLIRKHRRE
jgi:hypothetical protein